MGPICRRLITAPDAAIRRERCLPLSGEILVKPGDAVEPGTVIGYNSSEECLHILRLEVDENGTAAKLLRNVGDEVKRGEPVAYYMYFFGLGYKEYVSPVNGTFSSIDHKSGMLVIREHSTPVTAGMHGVVEEVVEGHSVVISALGAVVEGTAGWGDIAHGELVILADSPEQVLEPGQIGPHCRGKIVVAGALADGRALLAAYRHGARAVIAGGINKAEGDEFARLVADMSYEEYAARFYTSGMDLDAEKYGGQDRVTMTVLATEGFGRTPMRAEAFELLRANEGHEACVDGGGAGVAVAGGQARGPEIVVSRAKQTAAGAWGSDPSGVASVVCSGEWAGFGEELTGSAARVLGGPNHGLAGRIVSWGAEVRLETGLVVQGARLTLAGGGGEVDVPLSNIELIVSCGRRA